MMLSRLLEANLQDFFADDDVFDPLVVNSALLSLE